MVVGLLITVVFASKQNKTKRGSGFLWITTIHYNNSFNIIQSYELYCHTCLKARRM